MASFEIVETTVAKEVTLSVGVLQKDHCAFAAADDDHKELEVKVGGAPSLIETPQGLFAPDELNKNTTADDVE